MRILLLLNFHHFSVNHAPRGVYKLKGCGNYKEKGGVHNTIFLFAKEE